MSSVEACELERWHLLTWRRDCTGEPVRRQFLCGSWRCRRCAAWRGAVDYTRCAAGVQSRDWWLYCVLTFDPSQYRDQWDAYKSAGKCWDDGLRQGLRRQGGNIAYLQTWERHASGWPHLNLILSGADLRAWVESLGVAFKRNDRGRLCLFPRGWRQWLRSAAMRAGFGGIAWAEVLEPSNRQAMAGYLVKLASELTGAKRKGGDQAPINAPKNFRRIRASRGLLPALGSGEPSEWTGAIVTGRMVEEPSPARATKKPPESRPALWGDVVTLKRELRKRAELDAGKWAGFYDPRGTVPVLPPELQEPALAGHSPNQQAPRPLRRSTNGTELDEAGIPVYFE